MKAFAKILLSTWLIGTLLGRCLAAASPPVPVADEAAARHLLVKTLLSSGHEQELGLGELAETGSKVVHDVLTSWTRGEIYLLALTPVVTRFPWCWRSSRTRPAGPAPSASTTAAFSSMQPAGSCGSKPTI